MIRNNLFYKLLALGVALGLWTYVNSEQNPHARRVITVPLEIRNLARGYTSEPDTREAGVTIEGLKAVVDDVRKDDVTAWVDLDGLRTDRSVLSGEFRIRTRIAGVSADDINTSVAPKSVRVRVEALSGKRLPVEVKFLSAPPLGYSYSDPQITPASVGISGKVTQVYRVKRIVLPIPAMPSNEDMNGEFRVVPVDSKGSVVTDVTLDTDKVRLKLGLVEVAATKAVIVSQNIVGQPKFPAKVTGVSVMPSSVILQGKPSALEGLSTVDTDPVSIEDATGDVSRDVQIHVPAGVQVVGSRRIRITVHVAGKEPAAGSREQGTGNRE